MLIFKMPWRPASCKPGGQCVTTPRCEGAQAAIWAKFFPKAHLYGRPDLTPCCSENLDTGPWGGGRCHRALWPLQGLSI